MPSVGPYKTYESMKEALKNEHAYQGTRLVERLPPQQAENILFAYHCSASEQSSPLGRQLDWAEAFMQAGTQAFEPWTYMHVNETLNRSTNQYLMSEGRLTVLGTGSRMMRWINRNQPAAERLVELWYGPEGLSWANEGTDGRNVVLYPLTSAGRKLIIRDLKRASYNPDNYGDTAFMRMHLMIHKAATDPTSHEFDAMREVRTQARTIRIYMYETVRQAYSSSRIVRAA